MLLPPNQINHEAKLQSIEKDHNKVSGKVWANSDTDSNTSDEMSLLSE